MMTGLVRERDHYLGRLLFNQVCYLNMRFELVI